MLATHAARPGETPPPFRPAALVIVLLSLSAMVPETGWSQSPVAEPTPVMRTVAQPARTASVYIGSVMAMLATFEAAVEWNKRNSGSLSSETQYARPRAEIESVLTSPRSKLFRLYRAVKAGDRAAQEEYLATLQKAAPGVHTRSLVH